MKNVEELKNEALDLMQSAGFPLSEEVSIEVDKKLPFMGYTTEKDGKPLIVVAQWAKDSDMLIGLLIHELSHIYRIETNHPSHNVALQNKAVSLVVGTKKRPAYQWEILHAVINSIMDLYADDIFFTIFHNKANNFSDFFLSWVHQPVVEKSEKDRWINAGNLVSAAFAQANIERHHVFDSEGKIEKAVEDFLARSKMRVYYKYFKDLMVHLPEHMTEEEFGELLEEYLHNFLQIREIYKS